MSYGSRFAVCLMTLAAGTLLVGCLGGVECPSATYEPVGQVLSECAEEGAAACAEDAGNCVVFCASNCPEEAAGRCICEPCDRVVEWAAENCPDTGCLERSTPGELGWDLALTCTKD